MSNYKYFIAKAVKGQEFLYSADSMTYVPTSTRQLFVDSFNAARHDLKPGEIWHLYENDWLSDQRIYREAKRRNGRITISTLWRARGPF